MYLYELTWHFHRWKIQEKNRLPLIYMNLLFVIIFGLIVMSVKAAMLLPNYYIIIYFDSINCWTFLLLNGGHNLDKIMCVLLYTSQRFNILKNRPSLIELFCFLQKRTLVTYKFVLIPICKKKLMTKSLPVILKLFYLFIILHTGLNTIW